MEKILFNICHNQIGGKMEKITLNVFLKNEMLDLRKSLKTFTGQKIAIKRVLKRSFQIISGGFTISSVRPLIATIILSLEILYDEIITVINVKIIPELNVITKDVNVYFGEILKSSEPIAF